MTPDRIYLLVQLRMAENEALAEYARMTGCRRADSPWRRFRARSLRAAARRAPATDTTPARAAA